VKFMSLFAGIGGLDLGLERAGWECVAQVERDPFCLEVLAKHWPNVRRWTDVREFDATGLRVDAVVGGFPCQPHSVAGKGLGAADDRNLWPECVRILAECRPRWFVGENVPGLDRTMLADCVRDLEALGYQVGCLGLAAATLEAPHRRERRFIVARMADSAGSGRRENRVPGKLRTDVPLESSGHRGADNAPEAGEVGALADPDRRGRAGERQRGLPSDSDPQRGHDADGRDGAGAVGYAEGQHGRAGRRWAQGQEPASAGSGATESSVGGEFDGLSGWLDGPGPGGAWPNPPGPQAAWEAPRVVTGAQMRAARLKALGNAVVPQCASLIGLMVNEYERH